MEILAFLSTSPKSWEYSMVLKVVDRFSISAHMPLDPDDGCDCGDKFANSIEYLYSSQWRTKTIMTIIIIIIIITKKDEKKIYTVTND